MYISDYELDKVNNQLTLTLRNDGRFNIGGVFIYYSNDTSQEIATNDLSELVITKRGFVEKSFPGIFFVKKPEENKNPFVLGKEKILTFDVSELVDKTIYAIEITPTRNQEQKNKIVRVSCTNAQTEKILDLKITTSVSGGGSGPICGDGNCDLGEDSVSCLQDC